MTSKGPSQLREIVSVGGDELQAGMAAPGLLDHRR